MSKKDESFKSLCSYAVFVLLCVTVLLAAMLYFCNTAKANVRVGAGPNCGTPVGDGAWQQEGQPYTFNRCGYNAIIQYEGRTGLELLAHITYRAGFAYRKGIKVTDGEWLTDYCYGNRIYSGNECGRRYNSKSVQDTTRAFTLSFGPEWKSGDFKTSLHFGASVNHSTTRVEWDSTRGACSTDDCGGTQYWLKKTTAPYIEASVRYKRVFATLYYVQRDQGLESAQIGAYGLSVGVAF